MALAFSLSNEVSASVQSDCIIIGAFTNQTLCATGQMLDKASNGALTRLISSGDIKGSTGKTTLLHSVQAIQCPRILVVGLGDYDNFDTSAFCKAVTVACEFLRTGPVQKALLTLTAVHVKDRDAAWNVRQAILCADYAVYRYTTTLSESRAKAEEAGLQSLILLTKDTSAVTLGQAMASGVEQARHLGDLPPNICTPDYLADTAAKFAAEHAGVEVEILDETRMQELKMDALLSVARGSSQRPKCIILQWKGKPSGGAHVLVGKGITFDTGGVNLKTQGGIEEMKYDMCGGAAVFGAFVSAVKADLPLNIVAIIPAVENAIDGNAYRPSDVISSHSGKTIEVGNTDAEGRLILCDALSYAQRFNPIALVDVATLTGACRIALGVHATGLMSYHDDLANELLEAGETVYDRAWRLPLWDEYQESLDSVFADVYNVGGRYGGAITAGCFLSRFTKGQRWAHLDIAGVSNIPGKKGLSTGRPVTLLTQWLINCAHKSA